MKTTEMTADGVFLRAFDATIQQVHQQLALSGLNETAIWAAFHRATSVLAQLSVDVDDEVAPSKKSLMPGNRNGPRHPRTVTSS